MCCESLKIGTDHLVLSPLSRQDQLGWKRFHLFPQEGIFGARLWTVPPIPGLHWAASERSSWTPRSWDHSWPRWRACWSAPWQSSSTPWRCPWPGWTPLGRGVCASCSPCDLGKGTTAPVGLAAGENSWHQSNHSAKAATQLLNSVSAKQPKHWHKHKQKMTRI